MNRVFGDLNRIRLGNKKNKTFYQISNASYRLQTRKYNIKLQIIKEMQEETQNRNVENNYDK